MPLRLARPTGPLALLAPSSTRSLARPQLAPAPRAAHALRASTRCGYSSSSSAGRSSSRDGSPRVKQQPTATSTSTSPRSQSPSPKAVHPAKPSTPTHAIKAPQELRRAFELPHVRQGVVGLDAFFAGPRPLLELPLPLGTRRSTSAATTDSAHVPGERLDLLLAKRAEAEEDVLVVDQAEDGSPVGEPYLARVKPMESLKTVEEELAAEAAEQADLMQRVELEHEREAAEAEPYDAWLLGQQEVQPPHIARYLAVRPPFTAPPAPAPAATTPTPRPELAFLAPFASSSSTAATSSSLSPSSCTPFSSTFSYHFVDPLKPDEAQGVADRFLSHANFLWRWHARNDFIDAAGEPLRQAGAHYAGVEAAESAAGAGAAPQALDAPGSIRMWREADGWVDVAVGLGHGDNVFLPADMVDLDAGDVEIRLDSTKRKRRTKMKKCVFLSLFPSLRATPARVLSLTWSATLLLQAQVQEAQKGAAGAEAAPRQVERPRFSRRRLQIRPTSRRLLAACILWESRSSWRGAREARGKGDTAA